MAQPHRIKSLYLLVVLLICTVFSSDVWGQEIFASYQPAKKDSLSIGPGATDYLPYISKGYTLMLPKSKNIKGVLIFLEDAKYDQKNKSAKQLYAEANKSQFAVLSVSTDIPVDFYFANSSMMTAHKIIYKAFTKHKLPNHNIFFLGAGLVGHRAMRYIKYIKTHQLPFQLNIKGIVACNFTMDFTRKWHQHQRDIRLNRINLWEPKLINYLLETHLGGTPMTQPANYHNFSAYSFSNTKNDNVTYYKDYSVRAYIEPAIKHKLTQQLRTLYENNATDLVGFLAELQILGNTHTDLVVLQPKDNPATPKSTQSTWDAINKAELMHWVVNQSKN